jgi:hypothetical protein
MVEISFKPSDFFMNRVRLAGMDRGSEFECEFRARRIRVRGTSHTNRFMVASHGRASHRRASRRRASQWYLIGVDLIGTHLMSASHRRASHRHVP